MKVMKRIFYLIIGIILIGASFVSCREDSCIDGNNKKELTSVVIRLVYPQGVMPQTGVEVKLKNTVTNTVFDKRTDSEGKVSFEVPKGIYEASVSDIRMVGTTKFVYNGINSAVDASKNMAEYVVELKESKSNVVVIKELYVGGCQKDDGSGIFQWDKYVILYNNSDQEVDISDMALAMVNPFNSHGKNEDYQNGELFYVKENWIPAGNGFWYFKNNVRLSPYSQIVIAFNGAIDHTATYSNSVSFANSEYYCCYDIESGYNHKSSYPNPSQAIPVSHHMKVYKYGLGNAWPLSAFSPAFYILRPQGTTLESFVNDPANKNMLGTNQERRKVPVNWIVDAIEVFAKGEAKNQKRLLPSVDAGYIEMTRGRGYTLYRNVDKEATEAIADNKGKLVYNYSLGVDGSTDPSGIDAEASIKQGAKIVYKDTNNSSTDFHQRAKASIKNN